MNNLSKQEAITQILKLYQDENYNEAKRDVLKLLSKNVKNTAVYNVLGLIYTQEYNFSDAKIMYKKALEIDKQTPQLYSNLANIYLEEQDYKKAKKLYLKAISMDATSYLVYHNLAKLYMASNEHINAENTFQKAISLNPTQSDLLFEYSLFCLGTKDYLKGFNLYRYRYDESKKDKQTYLITNDRLLEKGTDINNKKLLLTNEQGYGDIVQFIRYVPIFQKMGAKVYVQVKKLLFSLLKKSYPNITFLHEDEMIEFDYHMPLMDAAYFFATEYETIPFENKYLSVDKNDSQAISNKYFKDETKKKIGIVWRTNLIKNESFNKQKERKNRNTTLEQFLKYFNNLDVQLYSLQVDISKEERTLLDKHNILSLGDDLVDFYDNALIIDNLDALIGIDTMSVIIAGAMGKQTVVLLPYYSDWRWTREDASTNWFKSITIARQKEKGVWDSVFEEVANLKGIFLAENPVEKMISAATKYHQNSQLKEAENLYRQVLALDSNNAVAFHYIGLIAYQTGHTEQAIGLIKQAISLNPSYDEAYSNLKKIAQSLNEQENKFDINKFALRSDDDDFYESLKVYINENIENNQFDEHIKRLSLLLKMAITVSDFSFKVQEYELIADMFYSLFNREDIERKYQVQYIGCYYNFYMIDRNICFKSSLYKISKIFQQYIKIGLTVEALMILYDKITFMYWGLSSEIYYIKTCDKMIVKPFSKYLLKYFKTNKVVQRKSLSKVEKKRVCYLGNISSYEGAYAVGRVMYSIFKGHYELNSENFDFYYYAYGKVDEIFLKEILDFGFKVRRFDKIDNLPQKLKGMRDAFFEDEIDIAVSEMPWAIPTYLFESRVAAIQIYLSLGWHYWGINNLEQLIISSDATTDLTKYSKSGINISIGLDKSFIDKKVVKYDLDKEKKLYSNEKLIIGSIQRLVKVTHDYLEAIKSILQLNENIIIVLAGPGDASLIKNYIIENNLENKIYIPGFVEPSIYAEIFHIYIDTFYFPGGHSCLEVMSKNKPVVSLYNDQWDGLKNSRIDNLLVNSKEEYIEVVCKLISDRSFYASAVYKTKILIENYTNLLLTATDIENNFSKIINNNIIKRIS